LNSGSPFLCLVLPLKTFFFHPRSAFFLFPKPLFWNFFPLVPPLCPRAPPFSSTRGAGNSFRFFSHFSFSFRYFLGVLLSLRGYQYYLLRFYYFFEQSDPLSFLICNPPFPQKSFRSPFGIHSPPHNSIKVLGLYPLSSFLGVFPTLFLINAPHAGNV